MKADVEGLKSDIQELKNFIHQQNDLSGSVLQEISDYFRESSSKQDRSARSVEPA